MLHLTKYRFLGLIFPAILPLLLIPGAPKPIEFGMSAGRHSLLAYHFGSGPTKVALIGGIHGGHEGNTVELVTRAVRHFNRNPAEIPQSISLVLIPSANPDGTASGSRFNGNHVDLNRNWPFNWNPVAYWSEQRVDPGPYPFSETETRAIGDLLVGEGFRAAVFYHSAADGIYSGAKACHSGGGPSARLAEALSAATGYVYHPEGWVAYPVTGQAIDYMDCREIAAVDVELASHSDVEWERNLRGMQAILKLYE
jgi:predicted deacylase